MPPFLALTLFPISLLSLQRGRCRACTTRRNMKATMYLTPGTAGAVLARFRLTVGRRIQLYHTSDIRTTAEELRKFNADGTPRKRVAYCRELMRRLQERMRMIEDTYLGAVACGREPRTTKEFNALMREALNPTPDKPKGVPLLEAFRDHIAMPHFSEARKRGYRVTLAVLARFLAVSGAEGMTADEFTADHVEAFAAFCRDEYMHAADPRHAEVYRGLKRCPDAERSQNTVSAKLRQLQAVFSRLEEAEVIGRSPFRRMGKARHAAAMRESYTAPESLTLDELRRLRSAAMPEGLEETRQAFALQCAVGARVGDFARLTADNISLTGRGAAYLHYVPRKTRNTSLAEVRTPLVLYALDIVRATRMRFGILRNVSGHDGYNARIRRVLRAAGITRQVCVSVGGEVRRVPLCDVASSKWVRRTYVTLCDMAEARHAVSGLHAEGSEAVKHYSALTLDDRFALVSAAYGEPLYRADEGLRAVSVPADDAEGLKPSTPRGLTHLTGGKEVTA